MGTGRERSVQLGGWREGRGSFRFPIFSALLAAMRVARERERREKVLGMMGRAVGWVGGHLKE